MNPLIEVYTHIVLIGDNDPAVFVYGTEEKQHEEIFKMIDRYIQNDDVDLSDEDKDAIWDLFNRNKMEQAVELFNDGQSSKSDKQYRIFFGKHLVPSTPTKAQ